MPHIRQIEVFLDRHGEFWPVKYPILGRADEMKSKKGNIREEDLPYIFGHDEKLEGKFLEEMANLD